MSEINSHLPLIVPVEEGSVPGESLRGMGDAFDLYLVLDGVGEKTRRAWEAVAAHRIVHVQPLGLGRAVKSGLNACLQRACPCGAVVLLGDVSGEEAAAAFAHMRDHPSELCAAVPEGSCGRSDWVFSLLTAVVSGKKNALPRDMVFVGIPPRFMERFIGVPGEGNIYLPLVWLSVRRIGAGVHRMPVPAREVRRMRLHGLQWLQLSLTAASFLLSSVASFVVDYGLFALLFYGFGVARTPCAILSRLASSVVNFTLNRAVVFHVEGCRKSIVRQIVQYYLLVAVILVANIVLLGLFNEILGIPVLLAKLITEVVLFVINYFVQRDLIFIKP